MAKGKVWKYDYILNMNVLEFHTALAHRIDKNKMLADARRLNKK
jgi:hypothetical protein